MVVLCAIAIKKSMMFIKVLQFKLIVVNIVFLMGFAVFSGFKSHNTEIRL